MVKKPVRHTRYLDWVVVLYSDGSVEHYHCPRVIEPTWVHYPYIRSETLSEKLSENPIWQPPDDITPMTAEEIEEHVERLIAEQASPEELRIEDE